MPLTVAGRYPAFRSRVDGDGMAIAGIRILAIDVPYATYTGWNHARTALYRARCAPMWEASCRSLARAHNGSPPMIHASRSTSDTHRQPLTWLPFLPPRGGWLRSVSCFR